MLQLNIWCTWWWAYVPETCRAKNTLIIQLPCCISWHLKLFNAIDLFIRDLFRNTLIIHTLHMNQPADSPWSDTFDMVSMAQDTFDLWFDLSPQSSFRRGGGFRRFFYPFSCQRRSKCIRMQFSESRFQLRLLLLVLWASCTDSYYLYGILTLIISSKDKILNLI